MTYNEDNLRAGLDAAKLHATRKTKAIELYNEEVSNGITPRLAIEHALSAAVAKGLQDPKGKLAIARKAAGLTVGQRTKAITDRVTTKPTPVTPGEKKTVRVTRTAHSSTLWRTGGTVVGIVVGIFLSLPAIKLLRVWFGQTWSDAPTYLISLLGIILMIAVIAFFGTIGNLIALRLSDRRTVTDETTYAGVEALDPETT